MLNFLKRTLPSVFFFFLKRLSDCSFGEGTPVPTMRLRLSLQPSTPCWDYRCALPHQLHVCFTRSCPAVLTVPWRLCDHFRILFRCCVREMNSVVREPSSADACTQLPRAQEPEDGYRAPPSVPSTILCEQTVFLIPRHMLRRFEV